MRVFPLLLAGLLGSALVGYGQGSPAGQTKEAKLPKNITILPVPVLFTSRKPGPATGWGACSAAG